MLENSRRFSITFLFKKQNGRGTDFFFLCFNKYFRLKKPPFFSNNFIKIATTNHQIQTYKSSKKIYLNVHIFFQKKFPILGQEILEKKSLRIHLFIREFRRKKQVLLVRSRFNNFLIKFKIFRMLNVFIYDFQPVRHGNLVKWKNSRYLIRRYFTQFQL